MKLIPRDASWYPGEFHLLMHPSNFIESNCPKCGEMAIGDPRVKGAVINIGNPNKASEACAVKFTCYGYGPGKQTCDTVWEEKIILRLTIESVKG